MKPRRCAGEDTLLPFVEAGGLEEIRITQAADALYTLSVKLKTRREWIFLATRRIPDEPRQFRRIEAAVGVGLKLFGTKRYTLLLP